MVRHPSVVCPVDFSDASRGALRYAAALAEHFQGDLIVLTVDDPVLNDAAAATWGPGWLPAQSEEQLHTFVRSTFSHRSPQLAGLRLMVRAGVPATEILRVATDQNVDLIVMSSHGATGFRRWAFGSTTARLLRQTSFPVMVTPAADPGPDHLEDVRKTIRTILVPVDLSPVASTQLKVAAGLAAAFSAKLLLTHVLGPLVSRPGADVAVAQIEKHRRETTQNAIAHLHATIPAALNPEVVLGYGDPAYEIARLARERQAGIIVMGMHSPSGLGPRIGSVTYRVLCEAPALVLALPPALDGSLAAVPAGNVAAA